jgi:hypothetical protein
VHPGGGIPLCLNSGKIVAEMVRWWVGILNIQNNSEIFF